MHMYVQSKCSGFNRQCVLDISLFTLSFREAWWQVPLPTEPPSPALDFILQFENESEKNNPAFRKEKYWNKKTESMFNTVNTPDGSQQRFLQPYK